MLVNTILPLLLFADDLLADNLSSLLDNLVEYCQKRHIKWSSQQLKWYGFLKRERYSGFSVNESHYVNLMSISIRILIVSKLNLQESSINLGWSASNSVSPPLSRACSPWPLVWFISMTHLNLDGNPVEELNASIDLLQVCTCLVASH